MQRKKLIELLKKAYLSGVMEKELADKMQGFKHDFESMATHYAEIEINNGVLNDVIASHLKALTKNIEDSHCYGFEDVLQEYLDSL